MAATPAKRTGLYDTARDSTTLPMIRKAIARGIPLLAICRGIQELNVALGGTLATEIQERDGSMDHRAPVSDNQDERFAIRQVVTIAPDSCLAGIFGAGEIMVNSVHRQAVDRLGSRLQVEALAPDGTVEAVSVKDARGFAVGVQWHPEYWVKSDSESQKIFRAFGEAARAYARTRNVLPQAAESGQGRRAVPQRGFTPAVSGTGVIALPSLNHETRLSTLRSAMARRVCTEAEPTCGSSEVLGASSSACETFGSSANTSSPAAAMVPSLSAFASASSSTVLPRPI